MQTQTSEVEATPITLPKRRGRPRRTTPQIPVAMPTPRARRKSTQRVTDSFKAPAPELALVPEPVMMPEPMQVLPEPTPSVAIETIAVAMPVELPVELPVARVGTMPELTIAAGPLGITDQVRIAFAKGNRLATTIGALIGGLVPLATYEVNHIALSPLANTDWWTDWHTYGYAALVLGGLTYSARKVYRWAELALGYKSEALGFTVLCEGIMTLTSSNESLAWLAITVLVYLMVINAIATGVVIARGPQPKVSK